MKRGGWRGGMGVGMEMRRIEEGENGDVEERFVGDFRGLGLIIAGQVREGGEGCSG